MWQSLRNMWYFKWLSPEGLEYRPSLAQRLGGIASSPGSASRFQSLGSPLRKLRGSSCWEDWKYWRKLKKLRKNEEKWEKWKKSVFFTNFTVIWSGIHRRCWRWMRTWHCRFLLFFRRDRRLRTQPRYPWLPKGRAWLRNYCNFLRSCCKFPKIAGFSCQYR